MASLRSSVSHSPFQMSLQIVRAFHERPMRYTIVQPMPSRISAAKSRAMSLSAAMLAPPLW